MRIISGIFKGHHIRTPKTNSVRPTTNRVKESMFGIAENIRPFEGTAVLDLFGGGGNLGLEALSRGADSVVFVDNSHRSVEALRMNLEKLRVAGKCRIMFSDVNRYIKEIKTQFDYIFIDPPYAYTKYDQLAHDIFQRALLRAEGVLVVQYSSQITLDFGDEWILKTMRAFGETIVNFYQPGNSEKKV